jgi:hypothetical protein
VLHEVDGRIPRADDGVECAGELLRHAGSREAHPGDIGVDGAGPAQLAHKSSNTSSSRPIDRLPLGAGM